MIINKHIQLLQFKINKVINLYLLYFILNIEEYIPISQYILNLHLYKILLASMNKALLIFQLFHIPSNITTIQTSIYNIIVMTEDCGIIQKISTNITIFNEAFQFHIVIFESYILQQRKVIFKMKVLLGTYGNLLFCSISLYYFQISLQLCTMHHDTNKEFTAIQSYLLYIWSGSHV